MKAIELVNNHVPPIRPEETLEKAISWMDEFKVNHLPVVKNGIFIGLISDNMVFDHNNVKDRIKDLNFIGKQQMVTENTHLYKVMYVISRHKLSIVPVCDDKNQFLGAISSTHLLNVLSRQLGFNQSGAIITLQMNYVDFQLSQIAQIIESNNSKILGFYTETFDDNNQIRITIKVNQTKLGAILQTFTRYDYTIHEIYTDDEMENEYQERYNHLMNYLNL